MSDTTDPDLGCPYHGSFYGSSCPACDRTRRGEPEPITVMDRDVMRLRAALAAERTRADAAERECDSYKTALAHALTLLDEGGDGGAVSEHALAMADAALAIRLDPAQSAQSGAGEGGA